jgi:hypothetical protein
MGTKDISVENGRSEGSKFFIAVYASDIKKAAF